MTAEVAVINKSAVAIASDSAVTAELIDSRGRLNSKIYNTANKLFSLSKHAPIGIMVYNTMELGGVPWETIIKEYRRHLGTTKFDHLSDYADHFFSYLCANTILFPDRLICAVLKKIITRLFIPISYEIKSNADPKRALDDNISKLEAMAFAESFDDRDLSLPENYIAAIDEAANIAFKTSHLRNLKTRYRKFAALALTKERQLSGYSGVVITGFGGIDIFPSLVEYNVDLIFKGKVRKKIIQRYSPVDTDAGKVLPFAQEDITRTILEGINPGYAAEIQDKAIDLFASLPQKIIDGIAELSAAQKYQYKRDAFEASKSAIRDFFIRMDNERKSKHTFQIENAIQIMPFSELAEIAEVFIRLTQVRRRLSPDSETVGGPIDVAVISKADGFIWVKRKFYFNKEFNYSFFGNYFSSQ